MSTFLSDALALHLAGRLGPAADLYERVLAREQHNADALHLFGVLQHQMGKHDRAAEMIGKAVVLRPDVPDYYVNLAEAYRLQTDFERAAECCRTALKLRPDHPESLNNFGLALQGLGRWDEAVTQFRRALQRKPGFASAHSNLGIALRRLRHSEEALTHLRQAVEMAPGNVAALTNLGLALLENGQAEQALPYCSEAVRLKPGVASLHHNLANTLRLLDRSAEAQAGYLEALRLDPNQALSAAHLGQILSKQGDHDGALTWLDRAVEIEPRIGAHWERLARLHVVREAFTEAIRCWERVLELNPHRAVAHNQLGQALQREGRFAEAEEQYRLAIRLRPRATVGLLNLAALHKELGELAEAEAVFREALRIKPSHHVPQVRLASLLGRRLPDADLAGLEQLLANPELGDGGRARTLFAMAHVFDDRGEHDRAAGCLRQANALNLALTSQGKSKMHVYNPADHERFMDRMVRSFSPDWFTPLAGAGSPTRRPVFVVGMPRSGTTLVEQVLASHRRVHGAGELCYVRQSFDAIPAEMGSAGRVHPFDCLAQVDLATIRRLADRHDDRLRSLAPAQVDRVVDKMPENYIFLGLIAAMFPHATIIHCRRDQRDVALSCWQTDFNAVPWANDPGHIAHRIGLYDQAMKHWRTVLPVSMYEVDYENLVTDFEGSAQSLVNACGLDWDPACLEFHQTRRSVRTASATQVRQPIYKSSVSRWKNYALALSDLFDAIPPNSGRPDWTGISDVPVDGR